MNLPAPQNPSRAVFARQPARILLVDFTPPFSSATCQSVCNELDNLFTLVCNMNGPCRVPYFGLFALGTFSENLFPLQHVQGNYPRLQNALDELRDFQRDGFLINERKDYLLQAVHDAIQQFNKQSQTLRQTTGFSSQLEVFLMTSQKPVNAIAKQIEDAVVGSLDVENLRRIQVISLAHENPAVVPVELSPSTSSTCSAGNGSQRSVTSVESVLESGIVEVLSLDTGELSLQNFFNGWLHDSGTDKECLYIKFSGSGISQDLTLTCDILEPFLDPAQLNIPPSEYAINFCCAGNKMPAVALMKAASSSLCTPVPTLHVIKLIKMSGICESVIYGVPLILKPTACWKLPWNELEKNQQNFQALCHLLQSKEVAILVRQDRSSSSTEFGLSSGGRVYQNRSPVTPRGMTTPSVGHFVILPSEGGMTMLIKSVAFKELMLPSDAHCKAVDAPLSETLEKIKNVLDKIDVADIYNPLSIQSGLQYSLRRALCKGSVRKPAKRPQIQQPRRTQGGRGATRGHSGFRGQRTRGHGARGQRGTGGAISRPRTVTTDYQPSLLNKFENFFPDFED